MQLARMYREIVETVTDSMWVFDLDGRLLLANPACAELMGVPTEAFPGRTAFDFLDEQGRRQFADHLVDLRAGRFLETEVEVQWVRPNGDVRWVLCSEAPLYDDDGLLGGVLHRMTDFTDRRSLVQQLSESEERLAEAQRIARIGSFRWDLASGEVTGSAGLFHLFELPEAPRRTWEDFAVLLVEDQRDLFAQSLRDAMTGGTDVRFVVRASGRQGWMWAQVQGEYARDTDGRAVTFAGTVQDVTSTVEAQEALQDQFAQNTLMEAVASAANEASTMTDLLRRASAMLLRHGSWARAQGFTCHDDEVAPLPVDDTDAAGGAVDAPALARDTDLALRCLSARDVVWHEDGRSLACPVLHAGEVCAVYVITSARPIRRQQLVEHMVRQSAVQIGRVAEREATARALAAARDAAEEASRQKSTFLATISHEIRTPLNGVIGLNELLLRTELDAEQRRLASGVQLSGRTLLGLISNVLDYSKIEAGHLVLESVDFDVRAVLDGAVAPIVSTGRSKGLAMRTELDGDLPPVANGDPTRLSQVLSNLVSNAVKFTTRGSVEVHVAAVASDSGWLLTADVRDTGVGTDVDPQTLFAPFQQADTSTTRVFGGTGLGLAISREIAEALGGEITFESRRGAGTRVRFTAPLAAPTGGAVLGIAGSAPASPPGLSPAGTPVGVPVAAEPPEGGSTRGRVLLVEDNPVNQMVAVGLLHSLGYRVETADDGQAALTLFDPERHDLVLMDLQMPRMDGLTATRELRSRHEASSRVPVIAMTASVVPGERERCLDAGMDDFLTKPVDLHALGQTIATWLDPPSPGVEMPGVDLPGVDLPGVDRERLDELRDMDPEYLERVIHTFERTLDGQLDELRDAVLSQDLEALRFQAHRLKGSCANLGLVGAADALAAIQVVHVDSGEDLRALLSVAEEAVATGRSQLVAYRESRCATDS